MKITICKCELYGVVKTKKQFSQVQSKSISGKRAFWRMKLYFYKNNNISVFQEISPVTQNCVKLVCQ